MTSTARKGDASSLRLHVSLAGVVSSPDQAVSGLGLSCHWFQILPFSSSRDRSPGETLGFSASFWVGPSGRVLCITVTLLVLEGLRGGGSLCPPAQLLLFGTSEGLSLLCHPTTPRFQWAVEVRSTKGRVPQKALPPYYCPVLSLWGAPALHFQKSPPSWGHIAQLCTSPPALVYHF